MFVLNAKNTFDVDANQNVVEVTTTRWLPGTGWNRHTDFIYTRALGDWNVLNFSFTPTGRNDDFFQGKGFWALSVCSGPPGEKRNNQAYSYQHNFE